MINIRKIIIKKKRIGKAIKIRKMITIKKWNGYKDKIK